MAKTDYQSIDEYIATFPEDVQKTLEAYRQVIHEAVPEAKETISYQIPCFKLNGPILYFSAFKNHIAVLAPPPTVEVFKHELVGYKTSVSAVHIPYGEPIPKDLIVKMALYRQGENLKKLQAN